MFTFGYSYRFLTFSALCVCSFVIERLIFVNIICKNDDHASDQPVRNTKAAEIDEERKG